MRSEVTKLEIEEAEKLKEKSRYNSGWLLLELLALAILALAVYVAL